jgi:hypothetical protein
MTRTYHPRRKPNKPRALLGAMLVSVYAVLLLAPLAAALADPSVETVDAGGKRAVYIPQTQPSDATALPRIEVLDIDGLRSIFIPKPADPTTKPTDAVPYPAIPDFAAQPGADLSKLPRDAALPDGDYTTSGNIKFNVVALNPGKVRLKLGSKQTPQYPDVFAGVVVTGGGWPKTDELKTAGPRAGKLAHSCRFTGSEGYGLLVLKDDSLIYNCEIDNNGSGGIGGTGAEGVHLLHCKVHDNNAKYRRGNSGGGKWTRGSLTIEDCDYYANTGGDVWADNYTKLLRILNSRFVGGQPTSSDKPYYANNIRGEISQKLEVIGCEFKNDTWAAICVDEIRDGFLISGNVFKGKADKAIEFRDLARSGYQLGAGTVTGNTFDTNALGVSHSGAGNRISLSAKRITIDASNRWPDGKLHVDPKLK